MFRNILFALLFSLSSLAFAADKIDINTADSATIAESMKGVGEAKAAAIVKYRKKNGPFKSIDDLMQVKGIGEKTVEANRDILSVGTVK